MAKHTLFSSEPLSPLTKVWFFIYILMQFALSIGLIYIDLLYLPYIFLALFNILAMIQLLQARKQGFYLLLSYEVVFIVHALLTDKPKEFILLWILNLLLIAITWLFLYSQWRKLK